MRPRLIAVATLFLATAALADDRFHIFLTDVGYVSGGETSRSQWSGGAGLGYSHSFNDRWSASASIALERRERVITRFVAGDSIPTTHRENIDAYPVDVLAHFRFPNDSRWTPYLSGGVHYVSAPSNAFRTVYLQSLQPLPVTEFEQRQANRMSAELGAGVSLRITPRMGLQFDLKRLLHSESVQFDPLTRGSVGLSFKF